MTTVLYYTGVLVASVTLYWTILYLVQRRLVFPAPAALSIDDTFPKNAQQIWLESDAGKTEAWLLPPAVASMSPTPLLIYGHGNAELIDYWPDYFDEPRRWGLAVLLVEYPGYGRSGGTPSEDTIGATFRAAYDWALETNTDTSRIIGYGRSLGGGAVAGLSRDRTLAALILESSFSSTRPFASRMGAPGFLVRDPFDNVAIVEAFNGPLMILHGAHDEIIPIDHGQKLADAGGAALHKLPCGHNDCPPSWALIREFLTKAQIIIPAEKEK